MNQGSRVVPPFRPHETEPVIAAWPRTRSDHQELAAHSSGNVPQSRPPPLCFLVPCPSAAASRCWRLERIRYGRIRLVASAPRARHLTRERERQTGRERRVFSLRRDEVSTRQSR
ncbi:hypothetical protein PR202_gb17928 [Eleusine coracana subsp. coracana]|uniref:Uncharacterized protein n=1 Tax=Eleusine coracana subsp. coracana TaxID=191504 RepID=A0AAV5F4W4_ELECO|nr:hypothetical protein PR202_gb17928 [Eleusine coracana subsp. coracana]